MGNYDDVSSLPEFTMFTWFFVIPGVLLVGAAGFGLLSGRTQPIFAARAARTGGRRHGMPGTAH